MRRSPSRWRIVGSAAIVLLACLFFSLPEILSWGNPKDWEWPAACRKKDTITVPPFSGRLLFGMAGGTGEYLIKELTSDLTEPRVLYRLPFGSNRAAYLMPDGRHALFFPSGFLVDLDSGGYTTFPPVSLESETLLSGGGLSPDGTHFAYILRPKEVGRRDRLFLLDISTGATSLLYEAVCANYVGGPERTVCAGMGGFLWLDAGHLFLSHRRSMPDTLPSGSSPSPDTLTIMSLDGTTVHSFHQWDMPVDVIGSEVIVTSNGAQKWLEVADLLAGEYILHDPPPTVQRGGFLLSPDGRYKLSPLRNPWLLTETRTGATQELGTTFLTGPFGCVWSPDGSSVACNGRGVEAPSDCEYFVLLIAPLSNAPQQIIFTSKKPTITQWGSLLAWLP